LIELAFDLLFNRAKISAVIPPAAGRVLLFLLTVGPSGGSGFRSCRAEHAGAEQ